MRATTSRRIRAVVPVKAFEIAKSRLEDILSFDGRTALARAMYEDVLAALGSVSSLAGIAVVTNCALAAAHARAIGARVIAEDVALGTNAAVMAGIAALSDADAIIVVQADLPLMTGADVDRVIRDHADSPALTLVPAEDGGTNLLMMSPPRLMATRFGADSFAAHVAGARANGIEPQIVRLENAIRDVDRLDDLAILKMCRPDSATGRLLGHDGQLSRHAGAPRALARLSVRRASAVPRRKGM